MQPILSVNNLTKTFGNLNAVNQLSFDVFEKDVYGFLGQNGAGKSTTIRMLLSLIRPTSGSIEIFGEPLHQSRNQILAQIGAVIEKPDVYKYLSAIENLELFARLSKTKLSRKQLMDQLEMVGLVQRAKDKVGTFSQGMKQRLGIAVALVHQPKLVILDEPTNGLDPQGIADIRNLILRLSREMGKTVIVSSHLLSEIEQVASRVLIIDQGKKLVEGSAAALFNPTKTIVEVEVVDKDAALKSLKNTSWFALLQHRNTKQLVFEMDKKDVPNLHRTFVQLGIDIMAVKPRLSLEDYFLQITAGKQHVDAFTN